jgi:hypothetical protein
MYNVNSLLSDALGPEGRIRPFDISVENYFAHFAVS